MNKQDVSKNILEKIKKEHIRPVSAWRFMLKKSVIWGFFVISLLLGSIAFSLILLHINEVEWDIYDRAAGSMLCFVIFVIPYFWIVFIAGFILLAYYNFRHTGKGYKYKTFYIALLSIGASMLLGAGIYAFGLSESLEDTLADNVPYYRDLNFGRHRVWSMEDKGLIGGRIIKIHTSENFNLQDFQGKIWIIRVERMPVQAPGFGQQAKILRPVYIPSQGDMVKVIGAKESNDIFRAYDVRPWRKAGRLIRIQF